MQAQEIIRFWFEEIEPEQQFKKDLAFDEYLRERFLPVHQEVAKGEHDSWRETIQGRLAEIIVLDQFSRNLFRDTAQAFAYDGMALILAQEAIRTGQGNQLTIEQRGFLYMPYMHSESRLIHEKAIELFSEPGLEQKLHYEKLHKRIIDRFGRYPHRNKVLGRNSTPEEIEFLKEPNSSF